MFEDWEVAYPPGLIKYNDLFRHKYLNYDGHINILTSFYRKHNVQRILEIGCGTGTYLTKLAELGYDVFGLDSSQESLNIAKAIADKRKLNIKYIKGNMKNIEIEESFDAVIAMHIPISFKSLVDTLRNVHKVLKNGGIFSFMYLQKQQDIPKKDSKLLLSTIENRGIVVARIEPWELKGEFIEWNPLILVQDEEFKFFIDHDRMELFSREKDEKLREEIEKLGYEEIDTQLLYGSISTPPWSIEVLKTIRKVI